MAKLWMLLNREQESACWTAAADYMDDIHTQALRQYKAVLGARRAKQAGKTRDGKQIKPIFEYQIVGAAE